ncbi:IS3 family transposase [Pectobacterium versatile]|uniref:IS3 family transposase n=1 Tax=Pectobacterium versatile TaxID=2488639 RepID=UPI00102EEAE5|nr:IS3 family transposase [Pectobacterium versatile]MBN3196996.1 IS3 family transposase [Pectobacterium versatile]MCA6924896.1 IS3 family transposase [Pectobacterium versatile]MCH5081659.1 IS3 family transposase [Pectobacterium versatile]TAI93192.1 IS3 family transposase [Pectobacterium versatile]
MMTEFKRTQRDYPLSFKIAVVEQVEKGEMTYKQAQQRYGIQGRSTVLVWLRKYGQLDWSPGLPDLMKRKLPVAQTNTPLTPEQRIKELEEQLKLANQKAEFFESVINVLKNDYGVSVGKKAARQVLAQSQAPKVTVTRACQLLGHSRQAWYQHNARCNKRHEHNSQVLDFIARVRCRQPRIGTRKLHSLLNRQAGETLNIGRDRLFSLLGKHRLLVPVKRAYHKTTNSHHSFYRHPNLLKPGPEQVTVLQPEQVWVADITYLPVRSGMVYLSLVTDACSRKIMGYHVGDNLQTENVVKAFKRALRQRKTKGLLIHHSDRGLQYCSALYQSVHESNGITCSMTDGYDCYQNALAERINGILKNEFLLSRPANLAQARKMVKESVAIYNHERPHLALKYKTPDEFHQAFYRQKTVNLYQD